MTWAKIDDAILDNPKIVRAGPIGFALHVAAITWCSRNLTDGFVPKQKAKHLLEQTWSECLGDGSPNTIWELNSSSGHVGRDASETIDAIIGLLVEVELWEESEDDRGNIGYRLHDYCEYNPTRAEVLEEREKRRAAGRVGGTRSAESRGSKRSSKCSSTCSSKTEAEGQANAKQNSTPVPVPVPVPEEREEIPPTPQPETRQGRRDPMAYLGGGSPQQRTDVTELFEAFKEALCQPKARKLRRPGYDDEDANCLAEAIDQYGLETCLRVVRAAPRDGWVSGELDERGQTHGTIRYIFGNSEAFARILKLSEAGAAAPTQETFVSMGD